MRYENTVQARFLARENRFAAWVELNGRKERVHVKNTGRLGELLRPGADVIVQKSQKPTRATAYDLIMAEREGALYCVDSQAPNTLFAEWVAGGALGEVTELVRECRYGSSRLDFSFRLAGRPALAEIKGVTLAQGEGFYFPDAPTERGVRHLQELARAASEGYAAFAVFVAQAEGAAFVSPNPARPEFCQALARAAAAGVELRAFCCRVTPQQVCPLREIPVRL